MFPLGGVFFFFFNDTATTEIYTLSLHDALPIYLLALAVQQQLTVHELLRAPFYHPVLEEGRSEEHTSELQSQSNLVCRLLLEKKKILVCSDVTPVVANSTLISSSYAVLYQAEST